MKKYLFLFISLLSLISCSNNTQIEENHSKLIGTFTFDKAIKTDENGNSLRIYNNLEDAINNNMYTSNIYPLNTVNGSQVCYSYQQSLKLNRNYSYRYVYSIKLTNSEQWGKDFALINVDIEGTFTYEKVNDFEYEVVLENPTSGSEKIYGANVTSPNNIYSWNLANNPSLEINIEKEINNNQEYIFNRYIRGRKVTVEKNENDRILQDNIYYFDVMNDIGLYCDYSF